MRTKNDAPADLATARVAVSLELRPTGAPDPNGTQKNRSVASGNPRSVVRQPQTSDPFVVGHRWPVVTSVSAKDSRSKLGNDETPWCAGGFILWALAGSNRRPLPCEATSGGFCDLR